MVCYQEYADGICAFYIEGGICSKSNNPCNWGFLFDILDDFERKRITKVEFIQYIMEEVQK